MGKTLINIDSFEKGDAENLQDFDESAAEVDVALFGIRESRGIWNPEYPYQHCERQEKSHHRSHLNTGEYYGFRIDDDVLRVLSHFDPKERAM